MTERTKLRRPETLTEAVVSHVTDAIISGEYQPGEALLEGRLAQELGTSRGTVREALRAMGDDGLVEISPHRGAHVSEITPLKASEIYDLREILEPRAVRLGVERGRLRDPAYASEIYEALARLGRTIEAREHSETVGAERELHRLLWASSEHGMLNALLSSLQVQTRRVLMYTRAFERGDIELTIHERLVRAALSGDPDIAENELRDHIRASRALMLERMHQQAAETSDSHRG